jgi:hypothetical protein
VAADDRVLAELTDPDGRSVVLLARIWENKITRDHPELRGHLDQVVGTVVDPEYTPSPIRAPGDAATTGGVSARAGGSWWS